MIRYMCGRVNITVVGSQGITPSSAKSRWCRSLGPRLPVSQIETRPLFVLSSDVTSNTLNALLEYDSQLIDDATRVHHDSLLQPVSIFLGDSREVSTGMDYQPRSALRPIHSRYPHSYISYGSLHRQNCGCLCIGTREGTDDNTVYFMWEMSPKGWNAFLYYEKPSDYANGRTYT